MKQIKFVLITPNNLSQILYFMAHHRIITILAIFSTEQQKYFYNFVNFNLKYTNIQCQSFTSIKANPSIAIGKIFIIMDIPPTFQSMEELLTISQKSDQTLVILLKNNKKYINMLKKKLPNQNLQTIIAEYSTNRLVGMNQKIKQLIDLSFDINRAAFYAYGAYINNFRANLLKYIFKTQAIDIIQLALSFGFTTAPRLKQGKFLKPSSQHQKIIEKHKQKKLKKRQREMEQKIGQNTAHILQKKNKIIHKDKSKLIKPTNKSIQQQTKYIKNTTNNLKVSRKSLA